MRRSWEGPADEGLDEPVTLTARQLRSLKWGARAGLFAMVLALAAAAFVGWSSFRQGKELGTNPTVASASEQASPVQSGTAEAATTPPAVSQDGASPATAPAPQQPAPAAQASPPAHASTPAQVSTPARASMSRSAGAVARAPRHTAGASKPITEQIDASAVPAVSPTPAAAPVTSEPANAAAQDSSAAHH